jgi:aerobic C4-dicarboxylate transport protein
VNARAGSPMTTPPRPWYTILYVQVLLAIAVGILIGHFFPEIGVGFKPLGDGFISLIKMMIAPVIFCTVVHGLNKVMANPVALGEEFEEQPG